MSSIRAILFDLDGTLIDTAPDMATVLNRQRARYQLPALPYIEIRNRVSKGSLALVTLGFADYLANTGQQGNGALQELQQEFLQMYAENLCIESQLFPGMQELLDAMDTRGISWGIVTNKPGWLSQPLLAKLELLERSHCLVSGDTLEHRKPHPAPLLYASDLIQFAPEHCVYIGDDERDIQAGKAAGMTTIAAEYGYIHASERPAEWGADNAVQDVAQIHDWLRQHHQTWTS